jgi:hypothetical protein
VILGGFASSGSRTAASRPDSYLQLKVVIARAGIVYVKWRPSDSTSNEIGARELL